MLKWGILSTANIGVEDVIPAILRSETSVIEAIASRDLSRAQEVATRFGLPQAFGSYDEMLASDDIDAVYIPLITSDHAEWTIKAANAGKHVLCEKPIALKADDIHAIIVAADRNKVVVAEAVMIIYHPQWLKVRELIASGAIGKLIHVQGAFTYFNDDANNMRNKPELGGGALLDIGVYPIAATRFVTDKEPVRVMSEIKFDETFGTDIYSSNRLDFGDFELSMYVSTQMALRQSMVFHGDKGWIELTAPFNAGKYGDDSVILHDANHGKIETYRFADINQYTEQVNAFARKVVNETQLAGIEVLSLESSLNNQKAIDALFKASNVEVWTEV